MKYIVFPDENLNGKKVTERISNALYFLTRPESTRDEDYVTDKIFGWIQHPTTGELAINWDENYVLNLHEQKNSADLIQLYININRSTNNRELRYIKNLIDNNTTITAGQLISEDMTVKTYTEMFDEGWFPEIQN